MQINLDPALQVPRELGHPLAPGGELDIPLGRDQARAGEIGEVVKEEFSDAENIGGRRQVDLLDR
jgi:hypothetical protein